ncbi:hypothetical protein P8F81_14625 [Kosakonia cowanii]|uniref:hypothetical protein n=1 Tax=Kosakonia cowanii TaxID=208223 RepID=UPI002DDD615B|nr:hypothetical protein [Kosakonia cowanii]WRY57877.1 hypothetical protein P8F81_14625 [Kosakonia cowanii]
MTNQTKERLIKFPLSDWIAGINKFPAHLPTCAYCICYQYDWNEAKYGPYGFTSASSKKLLSFLFHELHFYNQNSLSLQPVLTPGNSGLYFYGESVEEFNRRVVEYKKEKLKRKLKSELPGLSIEASEIINIYKKDNVSAVFLTHLVKNNYSFFFSCFLTPMAGQTFILFDNAIWEKGKSFCQQSGIQVYEADSVNELTSW